MAAAAESSRGTKNSRERSAKGAVAAEEEDGGFTLEARGFVRAAGEAVVVGNDRTCLHKCGFAPHRVANKSDSAQFANQWCAMTKVLIRLMLWPKAQRCSMAYNWRTSVD